MSSQIYAFEPFLGSHRVVSKIPTGKLACVLFLWSGQEQGILVLNNAITACTEAIEKHKGKLVVKEAARAVSVDIYICFILVFHITMHKFGPFAFGFSLPFFFLNLNYCLCSLKFSFLLLDV